MNSTAKFFCRLVSRFGTERLLLPLSSIVFMLAAASEANLLKNPGFEEAGSSAENFPEWGMTKDSPAKASITDAEAHSGRKAVSIPANSSIEQRLSSIPAGAYLARCWVKSETNQTVTFLIQNPDKPWVAYTCSEIRIPSGKWTAIEVFCAFDEDGPLSFRLGGVSKEFHLYHGTEQDMTSPILADDLELVRCEPKIPRGMTVWDASKDPGMGFDWQTKNGWEPVAEPRHGFRGSPVIQGGQLAGAVRKSDGGLVVYSVQAGAPKKRCVIVPNPVLTDATYSMIHENERMAIRVSSASEERSYTAWFTPEGVIRIKSDRIAQMLVQECRLRYGLLPSFAGTDLCYTPAEIPGTNQFDIPSTQWFVGLGDGNDHMLVAAWDTNSQPASLRAAGVGDTRLIETLCLGTEPGGLTLSFVEHTDVWHREPLLEDWLGEYVPIAWEKPFPARWMGHLFVTTGGESSFRDTGIGYSFPVASAKTRMWGVWFEDWNRYPFYFDGPKTMVHFEKTFVPQGEALFYFLEPAAANVLSPWEIVEQALGHQQASALFGLEANGLRKLKYSTPNQFSLDRPVCATTTHLSKIKQQEKPTVGVDLATHLYEFIREIRGRVDQYGTFFSQVNTYLAEQAQQHPEVRGFTVELGQIVADAQGRSQEIYGTSLDSVQQKIEKMKALLREGKGDGFNCGDLDVRSPAGAQDDLCRRYNRIVMKLTQTAALKCGDSPAKARIATYLWERSHVVLSQPTRWEPRRTLYFFEP